MTGSPSEPPADGLLAALLVLLGVLAWLLGHPYLGLFHDANLYALQALARLDPASLTHDVFLQNGSQDRFTLFSPLYAQVISLIGLDRAAALLTALSQAGLCTAAWWMSRGLLPRWAAGAGVVLLLALPCEYGPMRIFTCLESFLTPRMAAEGLTLGALAAALHRRRGLAASLAVAAVLLHPLMALAGLATAVAYHVLTLADCPAPRRAWRLGAALLAAALLIPLVLPRFDAEWLSIVEARSPYLFLGGWQVEDLSRAVSGLLPLAAGALLFETTLRRVCLSVLLATLAGWLVTGWGADLLHAVLITQVQPWRIEWLAALASALLLPYLLVVLWRGDDRHRSVALLLTAALIFGVQIYSAPIGIGALVLLRIRRLTARHATLIWFGALALCGLAIVWRVASNLEFTAAHYLNAAWPLWLRRAMSISQDGALLGALLGGALCINVRGHRVLGLCVLLIAVLGVSIGVARFTVRDWLDRTYPPQRMAAFAAWRAQLPPQAQVFWSESPLSAWALLRRAHYVSGLQSSGVVFSRATAMELQRRAGQLSAAIAPANFLDWDFINATMPPDATTLSRICRLGVIDYVVSAAGLEFEPLATLAPQPGVARGVHLYRCADPR